MPLCLDALNWNLMEHHFLKDILTDFCLSHSELLLLVLFVCFQYD